MESKVGFWRLIIFIILVVIITITFWAVQTVINAFLIVIAVLTTFMSFGAALPLIAVVYSIYGVVDFIGLISVIYGAIYIVSMIMTWPVYMWGGWIGWNLIWPVPWIWRIFSGHMLGE